MPRPVLIAGGTAVAVVLAGAAATFAFNGTESTTSLDEQSATTVDGRRALAADIVEGRTLSKYHPLPWVGRSISEVTCPADLPATVGAAMTCTATAGDRSIQVPVRVVSVDGNRLTWTFER